VKKLAVLVVVLAFAALQHGDKKARLRPLPRLALPAALPAQGDAEALLPNKRRPRRPQPSAARRSFSKIAPSAMDRTSPEGAVPI
jgi:hypothetical protein